MLRITVEKDPSATTLKLEGKISGEWVNELAGVWLAESGRTEAVQLDLSGVTFVDDEGKKLLARFFQQGSVLRARDCMNRSIIEEIRCKHRQNGETSHNVLTKVLMGAIILLCSVRGGLRGQEPRSVGKGVSPVAPRSPALMPGVYPRRKPPRHRGLNPVFVSLSTNRGQEQTPLTLRRAVRTALKQNPQVQLGNLNVATSYEDSTQARSALLSQAGIEVFGPAAAHNQRQSSVFRTGD